MSKHHRDRSWAPAPQPLPENAHVIDNHTHVASVVPFSRAMSHEAQEKGQPEVPVYSVDELLEQAQKVGVEGVIDCGCELPNLMTAIDMAGASVTLLRLDDELKALLDAPADTPRDKFEDVFGDDPQGGPKALARRVDTGETGRWRIAFAADKEEFFAVLEGRVRLWDADGVAVEVRAGDAAVIPAGFRGEFEVCEPVRKFYVVVSRNGGKAR